MCRAVFGGGGLILAFPPRILSGGCTRILCAGIGRIISDENKRNVHN